MTETALTETTTHDDGKFERLALVIGRDVEGGSVDLVTPNGTLIARINIFCNEDDPWLAVDVIDINGIFNRKRGLVFDNGCREDIETDGNLVGVDFRIDKEA